MCDSSGAQPELCDTKKRGLRGLIDLGEPRGMTFEDGDLCGLQDLNGNRVLRRTVGTDQGCQGRAISRAVSKTSLRPCWVSAEFSQ